jgi:hypothetical protein
MCLLLYWHCAILTLIHIFRHQPVKCKGLCEGTKICTRFTQAVKLCNDADTLTLMTLPDSLIFAPTLDSKPCHIAPRSVTDWTCFVWKIRTHDTPLWFATLVSERLLRDFGSQPMQTVDIVGWCNSIQEWMFVNKPSTKTLDCRQQYVISGKCCFTAFANIT